jgi:hypothetical protein
MERHIPENTKLGKHIEGFADFAGKYIVIQWIVGGIMKLAWPILVIYIIYKLVTMKGV